MTRVFFGITLTAVVLTSCAGAEVEPDRTGAGAVFEVPTPGANWYKGNTHAHTTESDGDSPPEVVARWYREHGYDFLVLSDHNVFTDPAQLWHLQDSSFLLIAGEEVTSSFDSRPVHVNGLAIRELVEPQTDTTLVGTIQRNVDAIRAVEGAPHINHPNFRWAFGAEELLQIRNDRLLEIWNGHPQVHNSGSGETLSVEAAWDFLLSNGKRIYGIAVDDAHHFQGEFARDRANPGRGWVSVQADSLDATEIVGALEAGHFYASTGVELSDVSVTPGGLRLEVAQLGDFRYRTEFIGKNGVVLSVVSGTSPSYVLTGDELYVRARVTDSGGAVAWTQPVFVVGAGSAG